MNDSVNKPSPSLFAVFGSVLSAMFGVQSSKNRERDFVRGKPVHYVIIGLVVTLTFILTVYGVVQLVLKLAGV